MIKYSFIFFFLGGILSAQPPMPFTRGVNLSMWFQESNARQIQFSKYTKTDFEHIKSLGCDVIRLPINMHAMTSGAPDFTIDPLLFDFLDHAVDWAEELGINFILDNHSFDAVNITSSAIGDTLIPVWKQFAEHFKNRSTLVIYEILNEPHGITNSVWNTIQGSIIDTIRTIDPIHTIIVGPADWNSYASLSGMPVYADTNLIYTFHFYDPFIFTHQGAGWANPSLEPLAGVPFPYDAARMPSVPPALAGTWIQGEMNNYAGKGTAAYVKSLIDIAADFKESRHVRTYCGEFGVYIPNSNNDDRVRWYSVVRNYLEQKGIGWTSWDYQGGFGLFTKGSSELFDYDINTLLVALLGLTVPPQKEYMFLPDSTDVEVYADYAGPGIVQSNYSNNSGVTDFYSPDTSLGGTYCIQWKNPKQYDNIAFAFRPVRDFSRLAEEGYNLEFTFRGTSPLSQFDIRFIDTKTGPTDHPWRMRKTIDASNATFDNQRHQMRIALASFTEQGAWDVDTWYDPVGAFDWRAIDRFEIAAEEKSITGTMWFNTIQISEAPALVENELDAPVQFSLSQNYPNPFNPTTHFRYSIPQRSYVTLDIFDLLGRKVESVVDGEKTFGDYSIEWNASALSSGVYFYRMEARPLSGAGGLFSKTEKLVLMK